MEKLKDAAIGRKIYAMVEETLVITELESKGVILFDQSRMLYKVYVRLNKFALIEVLCSDEETIVKSGGVFYSLNLQQIQTARNGLKQRKVDQLIKEIRLRVKTLKNIDSSIDSAKARVLACFGESKQ